MKIVVVNRNYFISGGPERYLFALESAMEDWTFVPFAIRFRQNRSTQYEKYFVKSPFGNGAVRYGDSNLSIWKKLKYGAQSIYHIEARKNLVRLIDDVKPNAAFFLNALFFSQSVIDACRSRNLPVIWRLSDFNLICGNYLFHRDDQSCTECLEHGLWRALIHKCGGYQKSLAAALVRATSMTIARMRSVYDHIDYFVCPSAFTRDLMIAAGFPSQKLVHIPTFIDSPYFIPFDTSSRQILYVGRLSPEKGVHILIKALELLNKKKWKVVIAGDTNSKYARELIRSIPSDLIERFSFLGFVDQNTIRSFISNSLFLVTPSVCYENSPNAVLESMSLGRTVVASSIGSLAEMIEHGKTGLLFKPGDPQDLAAKMDRLIAEPAAAKKMGEHAFKYVQLNHNRQLHMGALRKLFLDCVK